MSNDLPLEIRDLRVRRRSDGVALVDGLDLSLAVGETVGLVGESGSGKSLTALSIIDLLPAGLEREGSVTVAGRAAVAAQWADLRGGAVGTVFQDPFTALNPAFRILEQVEAAVVAHADPAQEGSALDRAAALLSEVGLDPQEFGRRYPHQLSGGQRQRVVVAAAMAHEPILLVADEPTTALDVVAQRELLTLMNTLSRRSGTALLLIAHDLPVVASVCARVAVMYAGQVVETGPTLDVLTRPRHPYTSALLEATPRLDDALAVKPIPGEVAGADSFWGDPGCRFRARCGRAWSQCKTPPPLVADGGRVSRCWLGAEDVP